MYPGISFFLPNITNGRNLKTIVTATHTAISVTALKSILSILLNQAKSTATAVLYGIFSSENSYPCAATWALFSYYFLSFGKYHELCRRLAALSFLLPRISVKITVIEIIDGIRKADAPKINRQITDAATPATALL